MTKNSSILLMIKSLQKKNIRCTEEATKDLLKLVKTDIDAFIEVFYKDFIRKDFDNFNKFEILKLNMQQRRRIKGIKLRRYEYRNTSNLRCIFIVPEEKINDDTIILCAFNEDGDKRIGKKSYNKNIERAITILEGLIEE